MRVCSVVWLAPLLLAAGSLAASERCAHSAPRTLVLDVLGVSSVHFVVNSHQLQIEAVADPGEARIFGQACASSAELLGKLDVHQERRGEQLWVRLSDAPLSWFGRNHAHLSLQAGVPGNLAIEVDVGSGDAWISGVQALTARVGSGDLEVREVTGAVSVSVGSGDAKLYAVGPLTVGSVGSGDVKARDVRGAVKVGSIGSGDFALEGAQGNVDIGSIGSGKAEIERVAGSVTVGSIGSGELEAEDIRGNLSVRSKGSGKVKYQRVNGAVELPQRR